MGPNGRFSRSALDYRSTRIRQICQGHPWKPMERHRYSTTIACKHYITIATGFQQKIALKQSCCLTVAQTAAKRSIRTDLLFARQSKKKCRIFCGLEGVVSTRDYWAVILHFLCFSTWFCSEQKIGSPSISLTTPENHSFSPNQIILSSFSEIQFHHFFTKIIKLYTIL